MTDPQGLNRDLLFNAIWDVVKHWQHPRTDDPLGRPITNTTVAEAELIYLAIMNYRKEIASEMLALPPDMGVKTVLEPAQPAEPANGTV